MRTLTTIGALLCAATLTAGCSTVDGRAEPEDPTASDPAFDPCDDIPDDAIRAIGMDPATESRDILGVHQPGWNLCGWNNSTHFVAVFSTKYTLDDIAQNASYEAFEPVSWGDREGLRFRNRGDVRNSDCYVAAKSGAGAVMLSVSVSGVETTADLPCVLLDSAAATLLVHVPE